MVHDFSVDPMHLVHEGAGQKLIMLLMEDSDYKISPSSVRRVNEYMEHLSKFTPRDMPVESGSSVRKRKLQNRLRPSGIWPPSYLEINCHLNDMLIFYPSI